MTLYIASKETLVMEEEPKKAEKPVEKKQETIGPNKNFQIPFYRRRNTQPDPKIFRHKAYRPQKRGK